MAITGFRRGLAPERARGAEMNVPQLTIDDPPANGQEHAWVRYVKVLASEDVKGSRTTETQG